MFFIDQKVINLKFNFILKDFSFQFGIFKALFYFSLIHHHNLIFKFKILVLINVFHHLYPLI